MNTKSICKTCAFTGYRPSKMPWGYVVCSLWRQMV
jgi:hypothetical protein